MKNNMSNIIHRGICLIIMAASLYPTLAESVFQPVLLTLEQGRYAVYNGCPISSPINIRTIDFISASGDIKLEIPSNYSVTVHQYKIKSDSGFITSKTGISGNTFVSLEEQTQFIKLSIKRTDNATITTSEGELIRLLVYSGLWITPVEQKSLNTQYESGRYAVGTGKPIDSSTSIRSKNFIPVEENGISLGIPSGYTVAVHEYSTNTFDGFLRSNTNLRGNEVIELTDSTRFVMFSYKKINNSVIMVSDGLLLCYEFTNINNTLSKASAMLTIIDDDGNIKYYTDIYPLALQKQVPISAAIIASYAGKPNYMTWDMIEDCQRNGIEILCHTYSHPLSTKIDEITENDFYVDYSRAIEVLQSHGINTDLLVFSGSTGLYSKAQIPAQQLFKGAFLAGDNQTNKTEINSHKIKRYRIGSDYKWNVQTLESLVDSLKESGGWMVWMMHTSDKTNYSSNVPVVLGEVIDYCKAQDIPIVTAEEGFSQFCN